MNSIASAIIELNNCGLTHFLYGDYDKAISMLRMAYDVFGEHRVQATDEAGFHDQPATHHFSYQSANNDELLSDMMDQYAGQMLQQKSLSIHHQGPTCSFASLPGTAYSMYNRGLVLPEDQKDFIFKGSYQHRTSAVILYNLALVNHNIGVRLGISDALPHALRLYEMALDSLGNVTNVIECHKLLLAILNNMGNIHTHFFHYNHTVQCLDKLRQALAIPNPSMTIDEDYIFFFLNALFQGKELCFAPAA
jgi:tetratricopeptide (TPR) repeat protein